MFWVRIRLGGHEYLGVLDTGATISIVAKKILPCGSLTNTMPTAAIRMGDGHVVHSCGDCEVEVPMGSRTIAHRFYAMDTEAFDFVLGTDFFVQHSQIQSLTLQVPYLLYVDHGNGRESLPLEQSEYTSSYLRVSKEEPSNMMAASKTEDYQLLGEVLDQGLKELGYSREDLSNLKDQLRPQDAIETIPGGDEYVVTNTNAPNSPCHVPVPDGVSECGLSELPSSIQPDDETEHDAFFVQTCVEEVENAEYVAPLKPLLSMRVEKPLDEELDPQSRLREYMDSKRRLVAEKLCYAKPNRKLMATEARMYGRSIPIEGGPRTEDHHLAKGGRS